ncbi:DNA (cytosine-5-)-methyltransferase [Terrimonas sp.]|uniref:DNA cytosine methyltransferase n=1 Tax=Terrimonas sp. TaxID=1914338 RepID=UPI000D523BD2|nr:DNA cytosine methyltransferase [Terrimonas sp.]PVD54093.1 DNA (cytosine-5-)-methyltransferase [Terrimonas sp.]
MNNKKMQAVDLFSGAGGMSEGAIAAGIDVRLAVEKDRFAGITFQANHPNTVLFNDDIRKLDLDQSIFDNAHLKVLFGGPPCQGFSTSNQKTRNKTNNENWLFKEYIRIARILKPDWIIVENVKGLVETESGFFFEAINKELKKLGYNSSFAILNAADFGVPQVRNRVFIVGSLHGISFKFPKPTVSKYLTVKEALSDLPALPNGADFDELDYRCDTETKYQKVMRGTEKTSRNNLVTRNNNLVLKRYQHIPEGGNWENIPARLMKNYKDHTRCHTGIYFRLKQNEPSVVIGNYRKNMLIHPIENRGLSVREAARLQSFPDKFRFFGSIGFQQQQVGNSVPPLLAKAIFEQLKNQS